MSEPPNPEVAILSMALELPINERRAYLDHACAGNAALRRQVEALLQAHEQAESFMEVPPAAFDFTRTVPFKPLLTEKPGDKIGRYKLLQQIGEGGCGVVYMAEQEEPVRRRVALKVIKLGMDTKQVIARFEAERQALALMDHPNIAKVFDAGTTDTGRPYFVMELVRGIKITDYCDQNNISTEDRLQLFMQVCQAIQHAHQKGIIHRDIKPSNILVTVNDDVPVPKVIDFGIAKATQGRLTDQTLFTAFEQFMGTPAYMSPEQAVMTSLDIDTRSDIYSLGVLLYELLTGKTPFDQKELLAAGLDEMRRTIREVEPVKPSTRLTQEMVAVGSAVPADRARSLRQRTLQEVRGDLDWIVMKCLEKDRTRRYETANGLTLDIHRHLDNEPIVARPPNQLYRLGKLVRRNKLAFAAGAGIAMMLLLGTVVSTWQAVRATRAEREQTLERAKAEANEKKAEAEAAKSQQVASFLQTMLKGVGPGVAMGRDTTLLREILDKTAGRIGRDLTNQPEVELELRITLFNAYVAIGEADKNEEMARSILRLTQSFAVAENVRAEAWLRLGYILRSHGKLDEAEQCGRQALAAYRKVGGKRTGLTGALMLLSQIQFTRGKLTEGEALCREAVATTREMFGNEHVNTGNAISTLAYQLRSQGKLVEAESAARESLAILRKLRGDGNKVVEALLTLTGVLGDRGRWAEAEKLLRDGVSRRQPEHPDTIRLSNQLGHALQKLGRLQESEAMLRGAVASARKTWADNTSYYYYRESFEYLLEVLTLEGKSAEVETIHRELMVTWAKKTRLLANSLGNRALVLRDQRKFTEAEKALREALTISQKYEESEDTAVFLGYLGSVLEYQGKYADAESVFRETLALRTKLLGTENPSTVYAASTLARMLEFQDKRSEANEVKHEQLALLRKRVGDDDPRVSTSLVSLVKWLRDKDELAEAETLSREIIAAKRKTSGNDTLELASLLTGLADAFSSQKKFIEAEPFAREGVAIREKVGPDTWNLFADRGRLGAILAHQKKYAEAESLLLNTYEALKQRENRTPPDDASCLPRTLSYLIQLYEDWGKPDKTAEWKTRQAADTEATARKATERYRKQAEAGDAKAQSQLASRYEAGIGSATNLVEAAAWYRKAAEQGNIYAQSRLGWMYANGKGVSKDEAEAVKWYRKAAEQRGNYAQYYLGWMYANGKGVSKDDAEAAKWYRKAAEQDLLSAQLALARMYAVGRGVEKDQAEAAKWLQKSIRDGNPLALNNCAWQLATSPESDLRDGTNAIAFAEKSVAATGRTNGMYLDTLAAAYAEAGQFEKAISAQKEAMANATEDEKKRDRYEDRLKLYQSNTPYRETK